MKVEVKFVKRHTSGIEEGRTVLLEFTHAERLLNEGYVTVENWDELKEQYEAEAAEALARLREKQAKEQAEADEAELAKVALRKENAEGKNRRQYLQTTGDIQNEEPKNSKKGGKK